MSKEIASSRTSTALRSRVPAATNYEIIIGSEVLVFKENSLNKGIGPFRVLDVKDKTFFVNAEGHKTQLSIDKVNRIYDQLMMKFPLHQTRMSPP